MFHNFYSKYGPAKFVPCSSLNKMRTN